MCREATAENLQHGIGYRAEGSWIPLGVNQPTAEHLFRGGSALQAERRARGPDRDLVLAERAMTSAWLRQARGPSPSYLSRRDRARAVALRFWAGQQSDCPLCPLCPPSLTASASSFESFHSQCRTGHYRCRVESRFCRIYCLHRSRRSARRTRVARLPYDRPTRCDARPYTCMCIYMCVYT